MKAAYPHGSMPRKMLLLLSDWGKFRSSSSLLWLMDLLSLESRDTSPGRGSPCVPSTCASATTSLWTHEEMLGFLGRDFDRMLLLQDASLEICSPGTQGHSEHAPICQAFQPHSPLNFWSRGENTTLFTLLRISFSRRRGKEKQTKGRGKRKDHFLINTCWVKFLLHRLSERVVWWLSHHHPVSATNISMQNCLKNRFL